MFNKLKKTIKDILGEYKQVKWPSLKETINLTIFVLIISAIITLSIMGLDALFFKLRSLII
jgi:preprotein translocase SecE subunit